MDPFFAYDANDLIDNKLGIIVDAEGTRANRSDEIAVAETMIERVERRFAFDRDRNVYICPAGAGLTHSGVIDQGRILPYRASKNDCAICALKPQCTTAVARKVSRDIDEDVRDQVRALANTEAFQVSRRERKKVEMRFAHMKRIHRLDRLLAGQYTGGPPVGTEVCALVR